MKSFLAVGIALAGTLVCGAEFEAENAVADASGVKVISDAAVSGGKYVQLTRRELSNPEQASAALRWNFELPKKGVYSLNFTVFAADGSSDSVWMVLDGAKPEQLYLARHGEWQELTIGGKSLAAGKHVLELRSREAGFRVDKFALTAASHYPKAALEKFPAPPVYPEKNLHPRVLMRPGDVAIIRARCAHPENAAAWAEVKRLAALPTVEKLDPEKHKVALGVFNAKVLLEIRAKAFRYVLEEDRTAGEAAVRSMTGFLHTARFKKGFQDVTRPVGETLFTAALVYDWCYPLMTAEQRQDFIEMGEVLCAQMEVGFPPVRQENLTGHASEAQVYRDLMCWSIAVFDECPEMYRINAGRVFGKLRDSRKFFHPAGRHHQGSDYGPYRYGWEMFGAWVIRRMCGMELFDRSAAEMSYDWIFNSLPDGRQFRVGDCWSADGTERLPNTAFYNYTLFRNPAARAVFDRQEGMSWAMQNPVVFLLFNEPGIRPAEIAELPLTHYFPMPLPAMTARSGWGLGRASDPVVVQMFGAGWQYNNHHHQDAGAFQIYHRGLLAADLGLYKRYATFYDWSFNKQSISHNTMLVLDPKRPDHPVPYLARVCEGGKVLNVGSQHRQNNGQDPFDQEVLETKGYHIGETPAHAFGPDAKLPLYSHLKCDLSGAYDTRVSRYFRSFVYVNTNDPEIPAVLTVFDRITATDKDFEKMWLLNSYLKPQIADNIITVTWDRTGYAGQLKAVSLLPEKAKIYTESALSFRGRAFTPVPRNDVPAAHGFRTVIAPGKPAVTDTFLTVMAVGRAGKPLAFTAKLLRHEGVTGAAFKGYSVYFSADAALLQKPFNITVPAPGRVVLTDLAPGAWEVVMANQPVARRKVPAADGTFFFVAEHAGSYTVRPASGAGQDTLYPQELAVPAKGDSGIMLDGKKVSALKPLKIRNRVYVPVRMLAGTRYQEKKDGFSLKRPDGGQWFFPEGKTVFRAGKYTMDMHVAPVRQNGEWYYPARELALMLGLFFEPECSPESADFRTMTERAGLIPEAAYSPANGKDPVHHLFDGDPANYWAGRNAWGYFNLFLGGEREISGVRIRWANSKGRHYNFEVRISDDGKNFRTVYAGKSAGEAETYRFKVPVKAAFVQFAGFGSEGNEWTSVAEFELQEAKR